MKRFIALLSFVYSSCFPAEKGRSTDSIKLITILLRAGFRILLNMLKESLRSVELLIPMSNEQLKKWIPEKGR